MAVVVGKHDVVIDLIVVSKVKGGVHADVLPVVDDGDCVMLVEGGVV